MSAQEGVIPGDVLKQGWGLNWWQVHPHSLHCGGKWHDRLRFKSFSFDSYVITYGMFFERELLVGKKRNKNVFVCCVVSSY